MTVRYDVLGKGYRGQRQPDPRIAAVIESALGDARTVVNVGAGTGSYEPADRAVIAVEPSQEMVRQRAVDAAPAVRGVAEALPFADNTFDAALAVLTAHHWSDAARGLAELCRVAPRQVLLTWDRAVTARFWLVADYLPEIAERERALPDVHDLAPGLAQPTAVVPIRVPADCTDGFLGAHWRRPAAYLDPAVRAAMSGIALLDPAIVAAAMDRLRADLSSGRWHDRHGGLLAASSLDIGYRLVIGGAA